MIDRSKLSLPEDGFNEIAMCRTGPMLFNRHDRFIGASLRKYGEFSLGEVELFRQIVKPGMAIVEVGANIGAHTVGLSRLTGDTGIVLAFEPQRLIFQTLCANLALNSCQNVDARQSAIGESTGAILVPKLDPKRPANFGGVSLVDSKDGEAVLLNRLDDFGLGACHFLKIDIEGMEVAALRGAADLIARERPVIYVEDNKEPNSSGLVSLLRSWEYRLFEHRPYLFVEQNFANDPENVFPNVVSTNLLCLPSERIGSMESFKEVFSD